MPTHALVEVPSCELTDGSLRTHPAYMVGRNHAGGITLAVTEAPDLARFQVKHSLPVGEQLGKIGTETLNAVYLHATRRCCPSATVEINDEADVRRFQREHGLVADGKPSVATLDTIMRHPHGDCEKCKPKFTSSTGDLREQRKRIWEEAREALEYNDKIGYDALIKILEDLDNQIIASFAVPDMSIDKFGRSVCPCGYAEECSTWCGDGHKTGECHVDGTHGRSPSGPDWHEVTALGDGKRHWINVHTSQQYWER